MRPPDRPSRVRSFFRRHGLTLALAAAAGIAAFGLSRADGPMTTDDWEAAAARGGWSTATPSSMPDLGDAIGGSAADPTVAALPEVYRTIRPASAAGPATISASEVWPAQ